MKSKKGITLVALIITIIVMVILAGVIITAAVANGGVIERAQDAIRENERADVQEIIIGSYVFKVTASTNQLAYLDLGKTGIAIYDNLTTNGFTVLGAEETTEGSGIWTAPITGNDINISVEGKHGTYEGTVTEKGLQGDLSIKGENNNSTGGNVGNTNSEEMVWGECQGMLLYIGSSKELIVTEENIKVKLLELNEENGNFVETDEIKESSFSNYDKIYFNMAPNIEFVDFGDKLSGNNQLLFGKDSQIKEIKGLEGLSSLSFNEMGAFENCSKLEKVTIPSTVTKIKGLTFNNCIGLTSIEIPETVTDIYDTAFKGCTSLTKVTINKTKAEVEAEGGIGTEWIPSSVTKIIYLDQTVDLKYEFTFGDILKMKDTEISDMWWIISPENFWADNVSEELKNSTIKKKPAAYEQEFITYNITCENENYINFFDADKADGVANAYGIMIQDGNIMFGLTSPEGDQIESENYGEYENLKFTILMP